MEHTGEASGNTGALPARQTWYLARRRLYIALFTILSASMIIVAIAWLGVDDMGELGLRVAVTVGYAGLAVFPAFLAWSSSKTRLEANPEGLHLVQWPRTMTHLWEDVSEIRPSIVKGKRTYLVLVQRDGKTVDLPVTEEHLSALQRWHQTAT